VTKKRVGTQATREEFLLENNKGRWSFLLSGVARVVVPLRPAVVSSPGHLGGNGNPAAVPVPCRPHSGSESWVHTARFYKSDHFLKVGPKFTVLDRNKTDNILEESPGFALLSVNKTRTILEVRPRSTAES
jgi:hypothetical protein